MKKLVLITLILCTSIALKSQSLIYFDTSQVRTIHKQQIRLLYCDSFKLVLNESLSNCKNQNKILVQKSKLHNETNKANEAILNQYKDQLKLDQKTIKHLTKRNRRLKISLIGVGILTGAIVIMSTIK